MEPECTSNTVVSSAPVFLIEVERSFPGSVSSELAQRTDALRVYIDPSFAGPLNAAHNQLLLAACIFVSGSLQALSFASSACVRACSFSLIFTCSLLYIALHCHHFLQGSIAPWRSFKGV